MKTIIYCVTLLSFASVSLTAGAQTDCSNCACLLRGAGKAAHSGKYETAIRLYNSARNNCPADKTNEIDSSVVQVFRDIDSLRREAVNQKQIAERAAEKAKKSEETAKKAQDETEKEKSKVDSLLKTVEKEKLKADSLATKARILETTFSEDTAYSYILSKAKQYFDFDSLAQGRAYQNAQTYFALATFLRPTAWLDTLVKASKLGVEADNDFVSGELGKASTKYSAIKVLLSTLPDSVPIFPNYETWRLAHIQVVQELLARFPTSSTSGDTLLLEGNWWTLPTELLPDQNYRILVFRNNQANFKKMPGLLKQLPNLREVVVTGCPNIRTLNDWSALSNVRAITLTDNPDLLVLEGLEQLTHLSLLNIDNCQSLSAIKGCEHLDSFVIRRCPYARLSGVLQHNKAMKSIVLADIVTENEINLAYVDSLEDISLTNMKLSVLRGIETKTRLHTLKVDNLDQLKTMDLSQYLNSVFIKNCDSIVSLEHWPESYNLNKLALLNNRSLTNIPDWSKYPNLEKVLIQGNRSLEKVGQIQTLPKTRQLMIIDNPRIITTSFAVTATIGPRVFKQVELELEFRRTIKTLDMGFKLSSLIRKQYQTAEVIAVYYLPFYGYCGFGIGASRSRRFEYTADQITTSLPGNVTTYVYTEKGIIYNDDHIIRPLIIFDLGIQFSPRFLKKDRISLTTDYRTNNIIAGFINTGITYTHVFGLGNKAIFTRPSLNRKYIRINKRKTPIDGLYDRL